MFSYAEKTFFHKVFKLLSSPIVEIPSPLILKSSSPKVTSSSPSAQLLLSFKLPLKKRKSSGPYQMSQMTLYTFTQQIKHLAARLFTIDVYQFHFSQWMTPCPYYQHCHFCTSFPFNMSRMGSSQTKNGTRVQVSDSSTTLHLCTELTTLITFSRHHIYPVYIHTLSGYHIERMDTVLKDEN